MTDGPNLFGVKPKAKRKAAPAVPGGAVQRLIGAWVRLFEGRFGEKPVITPADGAALKRLVSHAGEGAVERRLHAYLELTNTYVAEAGYPLRLLPGEWNRLVAADKTGAPRSVPDADATGRYLRRLKGGR